MVLLYRLLNHLTVLQFSFMYTETYIVALKQRGYFIIKPLLTFYLVFTSL